MTDTPLSARIEVFRPGTFRPLEGDPITYSAADLRAIADAYDPETAPAPIVVGHPKTDAPAFGWVQSFDYADDRLFANLHEIDPAFSEAVKSGRYKKVSMAFFGPGQPHNPVPGTWYPKHVGFLGAAAPAVPGLKNAAFATDKPAAAVFEFGERGFEEAASMFRRIREFFIEKFGAEDADRVLPSYQIEWLSDIEVEAGKSLGHAYSEPAPVAPTPPQKEEPAVTQPDPSFATREAELATREAEIAAREARIARSDHVSFAEGLVQAGKLLPASKDGLVAILDALPGHASVEFAAGEEKVSPGAALRKLLEEQPQVVSYGAMDLGEGPGAGSGGGAAFAADGRAVDPTLLALHQKALEYQRLHPGATYDAAVAAVS